MADWIVSNILARFLPESYHRVLEYPGLLERVELALTNGIVLVGAALAGALLCWRLPAHQYRLAVRWLITAGVLLPFVVRLGWTYAYDTPVGLVCQVADAALLAAVFERAGRRLAAPGDWRLSVGTGIACATLLGLCLSLLRANVLLSQPTVFVHLGLCVVATSWVWRADDTFPGRRSTWLTGAALALPFLPFLFAPTVPDADVTSVAEMVGFLFQGQSLGWAATGVPGEVFSLRYPAGFPALSWLSAHFLGIHASEVLWVYWAITFFLVVILLISLAGELDIPAWIVVLFSFCGPVLGWQGLYGGQVQEMLAYALGIAFVLWSIRGRLWWATVCVASSMVIHPIVAIPFLVVWAVDALRWLLRRRPWPEFVASVLLGAVAAAYLYFVAAGPASTPSQPAQLLKDLTLGQFVANVRTHLGGDTQGLYPFLAVLLFGLLVFRNDRRAVVLTRVALWLAGGMLIDGLFGHTRWGGRFQGGFSVVGLWILSMGLSYVLLLRLWRSTQGRVVLGGVFAALWIAFVLPSLSLLPGSVFATHSDVRLGRWIAENLPEEVLIVNVRPPQDPVAGYQYLSFLRGDAIRATVFQRLSEHQIRVGHRVDRAPYFDCQKSETPLSCWAGVGNHAIPLTVSHAVS